MENSDLTRSTDLLPLEDLRGKVILVTGASSGIGAAAALRFARLGCRVAFHYHANRGEAQRLADEAAQGADSTAIFGGDLRKRGAAQRVVEQVVERFGVLDVLVNNVGGAVARRDLAAADDDYYDELMDLNVRSMVAMSRSAIAHFRQNRAGCIVNVGSIAARGAGSPGQALYSGAKGFIASFTRKLAKEVAADGIRVNAIAPGAVLTPALQREATPAQLVQLASMVPLGRVAEPRDCTGPLLFLCSNDLSGFVTGHVLEVTGGF